MTDQQLVEEAPQPLADRPRSSGHHEQLVECHAHSLKAEGSLLPPRALSSRPGEAQPKKAIRSESATSAWRDPR
jgi:hypothetical protein